MANLRLQILLGAQVRRIDPAQVTIDQQGRTLVLPNHAVIINIGGILPTAFLESVGIDVAVKHGER